MTEFGKDATGDRAPGSTSKRRAEGAHGAARKSYQNGPTNDSQFDDLPATRQLKLDACRDFLLDRQADDGMWLGDSGPSIAATARYVLLNLWIDSADSRSSKAALQSLLDRSLPTGGWSEFGTTDDSASFDLDASVMAYLAIKMRDNEGGQLSNSPSLTILDSARDAIATRGGLDGCDAVSRYWLALFGMIDFSDCPLVRPEPFRWPTYFVDSVHRQGHWVRSIQAPLSIICSNRPIKVFSKKLNLTELNLEGQPRRLERLPRGGTVPGCAAGTLGMSLRLLESMNVQPWRKSSLAIAQQWIADNTSADDGLAGTWDGTMLAVIALISQGVARQSQLISDLILALKHAIAPLATVLAKSNSCESTVENVLPVFHAPTIDTAVSIRALASVVSDDEVPQLRAGVEWLLSREITSAGEGSIGQSVEPSGWCREFSNRRLASIPTTAMVLLAFREQFAENPPSSLVTDDSMVAIIRANSLNLAHRQIAVLDRVAAASRRGRRWLLALQNLDGGWGHSQRAAIGGRFRSHVDWQLLQDTSTAASTGRVLQALGTWEMACGQTSVDQAVSWLRRTQHSDGFWSGQHDASDLEATCVAISGLRAVGLPRRDADLQNAAEWCLTQQRADGGWLCDRDANSDAPSDPLATAWALLALVAAGHRDKNSARTGLEWLINVQHQDGSWECTTLRPAPNASDANRPNRVPTLGFRTSATTNAYAMLAIKAFEPFRSTSSTRRKSASTRRFST